MPGSRRLDINLHFNTDESDRQQAAARAKTKQVSDAMISDADAAEKAKLEFVKRANAQKIQELAKASKTEVELAKEAAAASLKAHKEADAARIKADKEAAAAKTKAEKDAATESARIAKEAEAEAKRLDAERVAADKKVAQSAIQAQREKVREATRFLQQEEKAHDKVTASAFGTVKQLFQMGAAFLGLQSASSVMGAVAHDLDRAAAYAQKTTEEIFRMRGAIRELAALRGDMGNTGPTTAHVLGVAAQTLQTPEDVNAMEQAALGIGELAIGKTISKENFDKSLVSAGKMATLEGGSADAYGALSGQIALQSDHMLSAEEHQARLDRMFKIQQPGGFRNMSQAAGQYANLNGLVMNKILTPEEAMGTLSAFSVSSPGQASTMTEQFVRATMASRLKGRGMAINPDLDFEKSYEYMKEIGADKLTNPVQIGKTIAKDFERHAAKDKNFNPYDFLTLHGFGNEQDKQAIMAFAGLQNTGKLEKIEAAQNTPLDIGAAGQGVIDRRFADRTSKDPFFQVRKAEVLDQLSDMATGAEEEPYEIARKNAFAYLKSHGAMYGKYEDWGRHYEINERFLDIAALRNEGEDSYGAIRSATHTRIRREAERLNIAPEDLTGELSGVEWDKELARRVQHAGGDLTGGASRSAERVFAKLDKVVDKLDRALNPKGPPAPIQGRPVTPRTRP